MFNCDERELAGRAQKGDKAAYGQLVQLYQTTVFNVCYRMMGERPEAEDMAQEAFVRAYSKLHTFDAQQPFGPWIRRVATNHCLNRLQQRKKSASDVPLSKAETTLAAKEPGPEESAIRQEQNEQLRAAIQSLPPPYRAALELRHFQELSYGEMAETLGVSLSTVKSNLFRARKALAETLTWTRHNSCEEGKERRSTKRNPPAFFCL